MLLTGSARLKSATVYTTTETSVTCEIGDGNLYAYDADRPEVDQGDSVTLVMDNNGQILAAW